MSKRFMCTVPTVSLHRGLGVHTTLSRGPSTNCRGKNVAVYSAYFRESNGFSANDRISEQRKSRTEMLLGFFDLWSVGGFHSTVGSGSPEECSWVINVDASAENYAMVTI